MQSEEAKGTGAVIDGEGGQWEVIYDPTNTFSGIFSQEEFQQTMAKGYWPNKMIFYNRKNRQYVQVVQRLRWFRKKGDAFRNKGNQIRLAKIEKPPVGERQVYR